MPSAFIQLTRIRLALTDDAGCASFGEEKKTNIWNPKDNRNEFQPQSFYFFPDSDESVQFHEDIKTLIRTDPILVNVDDVRCVSVLYAFDYDKMSERQGTGEEQEPNVSTDDDNAFGSVIFTNMKTSTGKTIIYFVEELMDDIVEKIQNSGSQVA